MGEVGVGGIIIVNNSCAQVCVSTHTEATYDTISAARKLDIEPCTAYSTGRRRTISSIHKGRGRPQAAPAFYISFHGP